MFILWLKFIVCAAVVVFSGYRICIYAEKIAQTMNIGRTFIGLILLAVVTSLPELAVSLSAVNIGAFDLVLGDLFGSNLFNLTIVGVIFLRLAKQPKPITFAPTHLIGAGFSLLLIALAAMGIAFYNLMDTGPMAAQGFLDAETALILVIYFFGTYLIFRNEKQETAETAHLNLPTGQGKLRLKIWLKFFIYSAILVSSAIYLSGLGNSIAQITVAGVALGGTFVGSLFMAITTSLPEMAVSISALRLGLLDMALGNIFGSNMFNMLTVSIADLASGRRAILSCVSPLHLLTVLFVVISSGLVLVGLVYRSRGKTKTAGLAWDSVSIILVYFVANVANFYLR